MKNQLKAHCFTIFTALLLALVPVMGISQAAQAQDAAAVYYVTPGGSGDCSSWENPCDLPTALAAASGGSEIWTAAGVYWPGADPASSDPRSATFQLKDGVAIYGGFTGTETGREERDPAANLTVLSGDIDGNDSQTPVVTDLSTITGNATNSYHVVTGADGALLDGVTITAGNANGSEDQRFGGGMYNLSSSPTVNDVIFSGNTAAMHGGGMENISGSSPALTNVTFSGNSAVGGGGGGMYNLHSSPTLTDVTFSGNSAASGGGMGSSSGYDSSYSATLVNVTFIGNSASENGGGMVNFFGSSPALTNVTFIGNSAASGGGMANLYITSPTLTNVTFIGNTAASGGGIYNRDRNQVMIRNTILWGNTGDEVVDGRPDYPSTAAITSSIVLGGCPEGADCTNVISADPLPGAPGDYGGFTQTIPLLPGSSAIDAGDDSQCPAADQRGVARVGVCDIGAFEYNYAGVYYTVPGGSGTRDGQSWANASDLRNALKTARSGDEIWAAAGVYKPTTDPTDRLATFQLNDGVAVYGGFAGTETGREERDPAANLTVLSGDIDGNDSQTPVVTDLGTITCNDTNSYHVVTGADGALLDGVTITAGNANGPTDPIFFGGGMYNHFSSPVLNDVTFSGNSAAAGGGMSNDYSSPTLTDVTFNGNSASANGGGMRNWFNSNPKLTGVTFTGNTAAGNGGGMHNGSGSSPALVNVTFSGNTAAADGGGMYNYNGSRPTLANVTFSGNSASGSGGGLVNEGYSSPPLTNVTFSGNSAASVGGMVNRYHSSPVIINTILWGDTGGEVVNLDSSTPAITSSVVQGGCPLTGAACTNVISADPLLGAPGNYGGLTRTIPLLLGSSAIDAGDDATCPAADQRGVARPQGAHCDIGAFEKELAVVALSDLVYNYNGSPKSATVTTEPAGLAVVVTYNGSPDLPVNAGDYRVLATINDMKYMGLAEGTLTILPAADLGITKADSKDPIKPGAGLVYTLVVSNNGSYAAQSVSVVDTLDRDTIYVSTSAPKGWSCSFATGKVTCTNASLAVGSTAAIKITVTVSKTVKTGKELVNNAAVSSATYDPDSTNNLVVQKTLVLK